MQTFNYTCVRATVNNVKAVHSGTGDECNVTCVYETTLKLRVAEIVSLNRAVSVFIKGKVKDKLVP